MTLLMWDQLPACHLPQETSWKLTPRFDKLEADPTFRSDLPGSHMSNKVSYSVLDPWITLPLKKMYRWLPIPRGFPPEGIVILGHLGAAVGGVGFAYSTHAWWGGLLISLGVAGNHIADCLDGTHARATQQCRNGGELLDHFLDPLSFSYWVVGMAYSVDRLDLGLVAVICLFSTAVLTNIKAKMIGEFTLASFGPTEFKTMLVVYGLVMLTLTLPVFPGVDAGAVAWWFFVLLLGVGIVQLLINLVRAVLDVNARGAPPDTRDWITSRAEQQEASAKEPG
jgi:archaetidylinositol phosphate synthase